MSYKEYSEQDVRKVLNYVGLKVPDQTDSKGNVTISSPLREDKNPSFSINMKKGGAWFDFGTDQSGNLNSLVANFRNATGNQAYSFIRDILANKYPKISDYDLNGRVIYDPEDLITIIGTSSGQYISSNSSYSRKNERIQHEKTDKQFEFNSEEAKSRLEKEDHQLFETIESYDLLNKETLQLFNCGIHNQNQSDWLSIPYETGVQLYRRQAGIKIMRMVKGSKPKESWFGVEQLEQKGTLVISKSPREAMLIQQEFGDVVDVISIASGESGSLSIAQSKALERLIEPYKLVKVIFDCDTEHAHKTTMDFTESVEKQISKKAHVRYINIHVLTDGTCKDVNDLLKRHEKDWVLENVLAKGSALSGKDKVSINTLISRDNSVDDAPSFPKEIYEILPSSLKTMANLLDGEHKQDVFLTSALPVIAAHMPNVEILHNDGAYSPDYFSILIANPGSGKGIADKAKKLGETLNTHLIHESDKEKAAWEQLPKEEKEFKPKPKSKMLFMPGNSSSRAVFESFESNDGRGLIFESEIDSMLSASRQEWGDFTDMLRKAFHHESISLSRKECHLNISNPELSIFMSGTFDQFREMFPSAENGYYSRFAFYTFKAPVKWHSHRPSKRSMALDERIERTSNRLFHIYQHLSEREQPLRVYLEDRHWDQIDENFKQNMCQIEEEKLSEYLQSSNKRLAVIAIRIAAIVAILRSYGNGNAEELKKPDMNIKDDDFKIGLLMANTYYSHTIRLYHQLPNVPAGGSTGKRLKQFFSLLPETFEKKEANFVGMTLKITSRSVTNYLSRLLGEGLLTKEQHGVYAKTN